MNKENRKHIDEFVKNLSMDSTKENIKCINEAIKLYEKQGEEEYKKVYSRSSYNLKELKYFRSELRKRKRTLEEEYKTFLKELEKRKITYAEI